MAMEMTEMMVVVKVVWVSEVIMLTFKVDTLFVPKFI
jgi:hypothetical protein